MALSNYDMDFKKMVEQLLGGLLRKPIRVAWLTACLQGLRQIHTAFINYTNARVDEIKWNGQTIKLEQLLINKFGAGIYIVNNQLELNGAFVGAGNDLAWYIGEADDNAQFIDVTYAISGASFTVYVPGAITFVQSEMEAFINKYKLHGTTYEIL
jgi:hypothetical protein